MLINAKPTIVNGDIYVHGRAGLSITYQRTVGGVPQDISADLLFFEIAGLSRTALGAGSDNTRRLILVENTVIEQLPLRQPTPFALRDETNDPPRTRWDGMINVRGFDAAPP